MPLKTADVERSLPRKGFEQEVSKHVYFKFRHRGKDWGISTFFSHGEREIGDHLVGRMAKQVKLSKASFLRLVECPMSAEEYLSQLVRDGLVAEDPEDPGNRS